jgi:hypothetical protein
VRRGSNVCVEGVFAGVRSGLEAFDFQPCGVGIPSCFEIDVLTLGIHL